MKTQGLAMLDSTPPHYLRRRKLELFIMTWQTALCAQGVLVCAMSFVLAFSPTLLIKSGNTETRCFVGAARAGTCSSEGIAACGGLLQRVNRGECGDDIILGTETATEIFEVVEPLMAAIYAVVVLCSLIDTYSKGSMGLLRRVSLILRIACGPAASAVIHYIGMLYAHTSVNNNTITPGFASIAIAVIPFASLTACLLE